ncbi:hypothetical protein BGZ98_000999 [Dissophora globulifera]|nr:hypothetical protein BGZ98_000999 [Dissophora globulifera]
MNKKLLLWTLIALNMGGLQLSSLVSSDPQIESITTTLAIEVKSNITRLSVLEGDNGLIFGHSNSPRLIYGGPGVHSNHELIESNWTGYGFLFIKDNTDESLYVHPYNTLFNVDYPTSWRTRYQYGYRPNIPGHLAFTLVDITAKYLQSLIGYAESTLGHNITNLAVVFPDGENMQTTREDVINHYDSVRLHGNPNWVYAKVMREVFSAARLRYRGITPEIYRRSDVSIFPFNHGMDYRRVFLTYHLGGSTFEVSVHKVDGPYSEMLSSVYRRGLGGIDFSKRVVDYLLQTHESKSGQSLERSEVFLHRLTCEVEKAKKLLSSQDRVQINIEHPGHGGQDLSEQFTRSQFEDINMDLFNRTFMFIDQAIEESAMFNKDDVTDIVFSGGSANIPFLQSAIQQHFGVDKNYHGLTQPETTAVQGAAKFHHWFMDDEHYVGSDYECCDGEPQVMYGIETAGGTMFHFPVEANDRLNTNKMFTFSTTMDNQDRVIIRAGLSSQGLLRLPRVFRRFE